MWMSVQSRNRARTVLSARTLEVDISALVLEIGLEENTAMKVCLSIIYNSTDGFDKTGEQESYILLSLSRQTLHIEFS